MDTEKILELLMELTKDMAVVKSKLDSIEEMKLDTKELNAKIERIEMMNERHEDSIKKLEHRADEIERFTRNSIQDSKKQQTSTFISLGLAIFSFLLSLCLRFF